jgi:CTD nuclear envelope phosphatase 1
MLSSTLSISVPFAIYSYVKYTPRYTSLTKVSKWYDCVIFTASVQEYADPVIDWLEAERKIFKARYYRQHCTVENGAYIKDLSVIERDLGKVCILDNSPISYAWHEGIHPFNAVDN